MQISKRRSVYEAAARDEFLVGFIERLEKCVEELQIQDNQIFDEIKKEINDLENAIEEKLDEIREVGVKVSVNPNHKLFSMGLSTYILENKELASICNSYAFNDYVFTKEDIKFTETYLTENRNTNVEKQMLSPAEKKYSDWKSLHQHLYTDRELCIEEINYLQQQPAHRLAHKNYDKIISCEEELSDIEKEIKIGEQLAANKERFNSFSYEQLEKIFEYYLFVKKNWSIYVNIRKSAKKLEEEFMKRVQTLYVRALNLMNDREPDFKKEFELLVEKFYEIYHHVAFADQQELDELYGISNCSIAVSLTMWLTNLIGLDLISSSDIDLYNSENKSVIDTEVKDDCLPSFTGIKALHFEIVRDKQLYSFFRLLSIYYKKLEEEELRLPKDVDREINTIYCELLKKEKLLNECQIDVIYDSGIPPVNYSLEIEDERLKPLYNLLEFNGLIIKEQDINYIKNKLKSDDDETKLRNLTTSFRDEEQRVFDQIESIPFLLLEEDRLVKKINRLEKKSNKKIILNIRKKHLDKKKQKLLLKKEDVDWQLNYIKKCNAKTETFNSFSHKQLKLILDYYETIEKYQLELHDPNNLNNLGIRWLKHIDEFRELSKTRWERSLEKMIEEVEFIDDSVIEKMRLRIFKICFMKDMNYLEESNDEVILTNLNPQAIPCFNKYMKENLGLAKVKTKKGK